jgi:hypothetical protein
MKRFIIYIFTVCSLLIFSQCEDQTIDLIPIGTQTLDDLFQNSDGVIGALNATYQPLTSLGTGSGSVLIALNEKSDDGFHTRSNFEAELNQEEPSLTFVNDAWSIFFNIIQNANLIISRIDEVDFLQSEVDAGLKDHIVGQAYFLRALSYYYLVNLYGGVPVFTEYNPDSEAAKVKQNTIQEVLGQIKEDLTTAAGLLAEKSELDGSKGFEKGRASKGAAYALKAEVHLMLEEWQEAVDAADMVIGTPGYSLYSTADYSKNFRGEDENGPESIFEIQYTDDPNATGSFFNTWYGLPGLVQGNARFGTAVTSDTSNLDFPGEVTSGGLLQEWEEGALGSSVY